MPSQNSVPSMMKSFTSYDLRTKAHTDVAAVSDKGSALFTMTLTPSFVREGTHM